jgi:predicted O-methyltransferase YrrM
MDFLDPKIEQYTLQHCEPESELLYELNRQTHLQIIQPRMLSGHLQGRILSSYSKALSPNNVLEIGTYTGYSALCMAEGLKKDGTIHTIDINEEVTSFTQSFLNKSKFNNQIKLHVGNALDLIPTLKLEWDLVFIDADKENYSNYFDLVIDRVRSGGWIIADNVLWSGKVLKPTDKNDHETAALKAFNQKVHQDPRVTNLLLPVRDGMMILIKK